jgi:hypothetical protein
VNRFTDTSSDDRFIRPRATGSELRISPGKTHSSRLRWYNRRPEAAGLGEALGAGARLLGLQALVLGARPCAPITPRAG